MKSKSHSNYCMFGMMESWNSGIINIPSTDKAGKTYCNPISMIFHYSNLHHRQAGIPIFQTLLNMGYLIIIISVMSLMSCSSDSNPTSSEIYFPQIENQWRNMNNEFHIFNFSTSDAGLSRGIFRGNEDNPITGFSELCGFYISREVEFNIERPDGEIKFIGSFINDTTIIVTSSSETLTLITSQ